MKAFFASTLFGLLATAFAEDYQYFSGPGCRGAIVGEGTLACGANRLPTSPAIGGINLIYANGFRTGFYDSRDCAGSPWFVDDGNGGCITDSSHRTNCIYVPC